MTGPRDIKGCANGAGAEVDLLLGMLDAGTAKWRRELGRVAARNLVWQPFPNGHSIGALLLHMADVEAFWLHEVAGQQPLSEELKETVLSDETQQYYVLWPRPPQRPLAWYFAQQGGIRARTREIVCELDDAGLPCRFGRQEFTLRWLLHHVLTHEAYHGGQAVLLSLMRERLAE
jgi:uncharacterized damage-inducible protein DinB